MLLLLIIIYLAIIALEVPILMREGRGKELLVFTLFFYPGYIYLWPQYFGWSIPNPLSGLISLTSQWV